MTNTKIRTTIALVTAVVTVMTVALFSAAPAGAAIGPVRARLVLQTFNGPQYGACAVTVSGYVAITHVPNVRAEAQRLIDSHHKIVVRVWDDDPFSDDLLLGPYTLGPRPQWRADHIAAAPYGLKFIVRESPVGGRDKLNGDDDNPDWNEELYAGVRLIKDSTPADVGAQGPTIRSGETNRVTGHDFGRGCGGFPRVPFP